MNSNILLRVEEITPAKLIKERKLNVKLWDLFKELVADGYMDNHTQLYDRVGKTLIYKYNNYITTIKILDIK